MSLTTVMSALELSQSRLGKDTGISRTAINRIVLPGEWPARSSTAAQEAVRACLKKHGATASQLREALTGESAKKLAPSVRAPEATPEEVIPLKTPEEEAMLLPPQPLTEAARRQFSLFTNPFVGEVTSNAEMFINGNIRFVREVAWQAAVGARMVAIVGESGAGKTTMLDDLKDNILRERKSVVCIEPSMEGAEETDTKGKTVKAVDIHTAIIRTFNAKASVASNAEARSRQVNAALTESCSSGHSHLLIIEEAHALPVPTLNHLKRLHEKMRLGRKPMLGILLVGHPELEKKLTRWDVREVMQRIEMARLPPLAADLSAYLQCRASSAGRKLDEFISPEGVDELRSRLTVQGTGEHAQTSMLYPLNINNWMSTALNTAADLGAPRVDRDVVRAI